MSGTRASGRVVEAPPAPPPNTQLGGYTLLNRIAVGGMAEVFRALQPRSVGEARMVVLKRMLPHLSAEPGARAMLKEEAELVSRIHHPNVVQVLDHGEAEGQPYLALEYVPGCDLWQLNRYLAREERTLPIELAVFTVCEILAGLEAVHEATTEDGRPMGVVHRDVSPSNILLSEHGEVKLTDFGIARSQLPTQPGSRLRDHATGKLGYLAPEQVTGELVDSRSDLFSTAVIAAELLMGSPLFAGDSELQVLLAIRDANVASFAAFAPTLPGGLGFTLLSALSRERNERPQQAAVLREALLPWQKQNHDALQAQLAELVAEVMESGIENSDLRRTDAPERGTPHAGVSLSPLEGNPRDRFPTGKMAAPAFCVRKPNGAMVGPLTYAKVVEAVATGNVTADDMLAVEGQDFRPLETYDDLMRHVPAVNTASLPAGRNDTPAAPTFALEEGGFVRLMVRTLAERLNGLWLCEQGGVRKEVYVRNGVPTYVSSNLSGELLGEYLVRHRVIDRGELHMALAIMPRHDGKLGDTLVALGLVESLRLFQYIAEQVREKLFDLFTWNHGMATFHEGVEQPSSAFPLRLDGWNIVHQGLRRRMDDGQEGHLLGQPPKRLIRRVQPQPPYMHTAQLPDDLAAALDRLALPMPLYELLEKAMEPGDMKKGYRVLAILFHLGAVEWDEGTAPLTAVS